MPGFQHPQGRRGTEGQGSGEAEEELWECGAVQPRQDLSRQLPPLTSTRRERLPLWSRCNNQGRIPPRFVARAHAHGSSTEPKSGDFAY